MNVDYYRAGRAFTEALANELFKSAGFNSQLNNRFSRSAVDILIDETKVDVQYSNNFASYGDFRLDLISAFNYRHPNKATITPPSNNIFDVFEGKKNAIIHKKGKFFEHPDYLDHVIIFFYNNKLDRSNLPKDIDLAKLPSGAIPDFSLIVSSDALINFVENNAELLYKYIKVNNKKWNNIQESHESAFIPISVAIIQKYFAKTDYLWCEGLPSSAALSTYFNK